MRANARAVYRASREDAGIRPRGQSVSTVPVGQMDRRMACDRMTVQYTPRRRLNWGTVQMQIRDS